MTVIVLSLSILFSSPSAQTLATIAVFVANTDRQWPVDEREPFVTAEALRLLEAAGRSLADDWGVNDGDVHESIAAFSLSRVALEKQARGDDDRPRYVREALANAESMLDALAAAVDLDETTPQLLARLEDTTDEFDRKRQVRQQVDVLETFFGHAAALMRELADSPPPR